MASEQLRRIATAPRSPALVRVDGSIETAFAGDTLLTVLLTTGAAVRGFEFGPGQRAGFCLMGACQDCWVDTNNGRQRACTTLVWDGCEITTGRNANG